MEIGLLGGCHAGVSQSSGNTRNRHTGEKQQGGVGVAQTVDGNDRNIAPLAMAAQNIIDGGVVDLAIHKNRLIVRQTFYKLGKTDNRLPINLNFTNR